MTYVILKDYNNDHLKLVKALKKDQDIKLMKYRKDTVTLHWFEAVVTFLSAYIGVWNCPLAYITREVSLPDPQRPALLINKCYLDGHNLIKECISFLSHNHSLYKEDNAKVYEFFEETLCGSAMDPTIKPYKCQKDDRKAWIAFSEQHVGKDKWLTELTIKEENLLKQRIYIGKAQSRYSLEMYYDSHRHSHL